MKEMEGFFFLFVGVKYEKSTAGFDSLETSKTLETEFVKSKV